jgi:hypothetical protein
MAAEFEDIPTLDGWVNLTEAAEMIGITRQHAHKKVRLANEGKPNGWKSVRRVGSKPMYVVSLSEIAEMLETAEGTVPVETNLVKGTLSPEDRERWLKNHGQTRAECTDQVILMAIGSGFA